MLPFRGLSVCCLSVSLSVRFVHCAEMEMEVDIDTISLAYDRSISLPDRVKNFAYIGRPIPP